MVMALLAWVGLLAACAVHDQHITSALRHADQAVANGQRQDNNALAEQATVALRYAFLSERNRNHDPRLQEVIRRLKEAVQHARHGRSEAGVQAVEEAYRLLAEME